MRTDPVRPTRRPRPETRPERVVVVGGGIAGLAAAAAVRRERPDVEVVVLEQADRVGGKLRTGEVAGVHVDVGAESMLHRRPEGVALARASGLGHLVVHPTTSQARIWTRGVLRRLPRSVMGVPVDLGDLTRSRVLSRRGVARARLDRVLPRTELGGQDVSVGRLIEDRLGREVLDRLVEPLLGGVYAGHAREISARAAVPQVVALLDRDRSLIRAAGASLGPEAGGVPVFAGLSGGLGRLPDAVVASCAAVVRTGTTARDLVRTSTGAWHVVVGPVAAPEVVEADAVVVAIPAPAAARLVASVAPGAATDLAQVEYASTAVVTLAFAAAGFPDVAGSGFLVPPVEGRRIKAATYSWAKWDWVREACGPDLVVLRTSVGRHREERELQVTDEELVARSVADLREAVGLRTGPADSLVTRWGGGLPQYAVGHLDRVRRVRSALAQVPGLEVCGAAYDGVGVPACTASGEVAAQGALAHLGVDRG